MSEGEENAFGVWMMEGQFRFERVPMTRSHAGPGPGIAENSWLAAIGWWSVRAEDVHCVLRGRPCLLTFCLFGSLKRSLSVDDRVVTVLVVSCFFFRLFSFWSRFAGTRLRGSCPWQDAASRV